MKFNINKVMVCRNCGALLLPDMEAKHAEFHQAIVDLATATAGHNDSIGKLASAVGDSLAALRSAILDRSRV